MCNENNYRVSEAMVSIYNMGVGALQSPNTPTDLRDCIRSIVELSREALQDEAEQGMEMD